MKKKQPTKKRKQKICDPETEEALSANSYDGSAYDTLLHAALARMTSYISPASLGLALYDWSSHLAMSPAKRLNLIRKAVELASRFGVQSQYLLNNQTDQANKYFIHPRENDNRFKGESWQEYPYNMYAQAFLLCERWWKAATTNIEGVSTHHQDIINFGARQILDMFSPSNFPLTNPEVFNATVKSLGMNFLDGFKNYIEDIYRQYNKLPQIGSDAFPVGEKVAVTPGKVIYRNKLIELIQYEPTTKKVYAEPILIIPAWIMKYYILDLSPHNSLVKYLVDKGHTVFMISWKNPTSDDRNLGMDDYHHLGVLAALNTINQIVPHKKVHVTGYCLGGTLLMIAAAAMAATGDDRIKTISLFAAQIDFRNPGELGLFIDKSQIAYLEDVMWEKGYLDGSQMAGAFSMLRSNDLFWSRLIHDYMLGKRRPMNDLMAWDHDTTRLPYRMHSEYLNDLFLQNDLVQGRFQVGKRRIALTDINVPIFVVGTLKDHVSPWKSVYRVTLFTNTQVTFVLTSGGHNAGIVSEPGHKGRTYQMQTHEVGDKHISSDRWLERAPKYNGSWWPAWEKWLAEHSSGLVKPPTMGNPKKDLHVICDAPGSYVFEH